MRAGVRELDGAPLQSGDGLALDTPEGVMADVRIELYGIARARAGVASIDVEADSLGGALRALREACPGLQAEVVNEEGSLTRFFVASRHRIAAQPSGVITE